MSDIIQATVIYAEGCPHEESISNEDYYLHNLLDADEIMAYIEPIENSRWELTIKSTYTPATYSDPEEYSIDVLKVERLAESDVEVQYG